jgi:hypothetical protein
MKSIDFAGLRTLARRVRTNLPLASCFMGALISALRRQAGRGALVTCVGLRTVTNEQVTLRIACQALHKRRQLRRERIKAEADACQIWTRLEPNLSVACHLNPLGAASAPITPIIRGRGKHPEAMLGSAPRKPTKMLALAICTFPHSRPDIAYEETGASSVPRYWSMVSEVTARTGRPANAYRAPPVSQRSP